MVASRGTHADVGVALPDFTLAAFALAGLWLRSAGAFALLCGAAFAIDVVAVTLGGVSASCFSWAYPFLVPAYACLWAAGRHARARGGAPARLSVALPAAWLASYVISSGSYFLVEVHGRVAFGQYYSANVGFATRQLLWTVGYVAAGVALAAWAGRSRAERVGLLRQRG
jgi:hypothetical protein